MDLALRVYIDAAEKEDESSDGEDSGRYYLQIEISHTIFRLTLQK